MLKTVVLLTTVVALAAGSAQAAIQKLPVGAGITSLNTSCSGISATATGSDPNRIASSQFTLEALNPDGTTTLVDSKTITYTTPLPREVNETWNSTTALTPGVTYRLTFRIFEKSGFSPAAAGGDFTCT